MTASSPAVKRHTISSIDSASGGGDLWGLDLVVLDLADVFVAEEEADEEADCNEEDDSKANDALLASCTIGD